MSTATSAGSSARTGFPWRAGRRESGSDTGNRYLDNLYEEYGVCVELDGTAAHPEDEQWRDKRRDNANLFGGIVTLRFGFPELGEHRCESAAYVAAVLRREAGRHPPPLPPPRLLHRKAQLHDRGQFRRKCAGTARDHEANLEARAWWSLEAGVAMGLAGWQDW